MNVIEEVTGPDAERLLIDAIDRNYAIAIDLKDEQQWLRYPSRFLELGRSRPPVLRLEPPMQAAGRPVRLATGRKLIVNFTANGERYRFAAAVIQTGRFRLAGGTQVDGLVVTCPSCVQRLQRRGAFRHQIPLTQVVVVTLWEGGQTQRDLANAGGEPVYTGRLHNVSADGLCVRLYGRSHLGLNPDDLLGFEFELQPGVLLRLDGRIRRRSVGADAGLELGVKLEAPQTPHAQQMTSALARQLAELEQQAARRARIG